MSESTRMGVYVRAHVCRTCGWFEKPFAPRAICPYCAGELELTTGRYKIRESRGFLRGRRLEYLAFEEGVPPRPASPPPPPLPKLVECPVCSARFPTGVHVCK